MKTRRMKTMISRIGTSAQVAPPLPRDRLSRTTNGHASMPREERHRINTAETWRRPKSARRHREADEDEDECEGEGAVKGGRTGKGELDESGLSEYEALRLRNIARNAAMLADIGIDAAVSSVSATHTPKGVAKPVKRARESREPVRRSTRGRGALV